MTATNATLERLNQTDEPETYGGELLGDDGCNQLWNFDGKFANRFYDDEIDDEMPAPIWDDDIEGWNIPAEDALV
jgi:hypothetical protein